MMISQQKTMSRMGKTVKKYRLTRNMTQEELAFIAGTSPSVISKLERGHTENIGVRTVKKLASALGVSEFVLLAPEDCECLQTLSMLQEQVKTMWDDIKEASIPTASDTQCYLQKTFLDILVQIYEMLKMWLDP